jgi:hypothetical protein
MNCNTTFNVRPVCGNALVDGMNYWKVVGSWLGAIGETIPMNYMLNFLGF